MKINELGLPQSLFTESKTPGDTQARLIQPEKLVSWAEEGRRDAIARLCRSDYVRELASINEWESERIRQIEEEWTASGNDDDIHGGKYVGVKHYHTTREEVAREAERKRAGVRERMTARQTAIERLVQEAREFLLAHRPQQEDHDILAYLMLFGVLIVAGYTLFN